MLKQESREVGATVSEEKLYRLRFIYIYIYMLLAVSILS